MSDPTGRYEQMRERIANPLIVLAVGDDDEEVCKALEQAQTDAATLWRALEAACLDGWADGPGALRHYISEASLSSDEQRTRSAGGSE